MIGKNYSTNSLQSTNNVRNLNYVRRGDSRLIYETERKKELFQRKNPGARTGERKRLLFRSKNLNNNLVETRVFDFGSRGGLLTSFKLLRHYGGSDNTVRLNNE